MKKNTFAAVSAVLILSAAVLLTGCGSAESQNNEKTNTYTKTNSVSDTAEEKTASGSNSAAATDSDLFTERDLEQEADLGEAKSMTVTDGETVTITEAGVYVLSGSAKNACVVVEAGEDDKVQLVLDGLTITNDDQPCILVESADKVFLTSAEGSENTLTVTGSFSGDEDAVVFSREDLVLQGLGTVTVNSSKDGIRSNDDLKLTGGTWIVKASNDALKAHDRILACDGVYELSAAEGIEATQVILNDGTFSIQATDDGINAGRKSSTLSVKIEINGGDITIVMGAGDTDGVDSNGDLVITGGNINITAQSPFDYDGSLTHTGGTIIVNGTETASITNQMMGGPMGGQECQPGGQMGDFGGKRR